jgi:glycine C-acetyltransferase
MQGRIPYRFTRQLTNLQHSRRAIDSLATQLHAQLAGLRAAGTYKAERLLDSPQGALIRVGGREVINLCANNYLGLASHPAVIAAAHAGLDRHGYGCASVRFICGTQGIHAELEARLSAFLGTEATILYSSCFDANGGLFETLLDEQDAVISDALNHASIIDGIRLCKARRLRYANRDLAELEARLVESQDARTRLIITDGVFSMDGTFAPLQAISALAERYHATLAVDDSHATGFIGARGRGTHELAGVMDRVDLLTGTLGKALGGASGGYVAGPRTVIEWLRQRSRPYLFSNSIPPVVAATTLAVLDLIESGDALRRQLAVNAGYFRAQMQAAGFTLVPGEHPIVPVMLGDAALATRMADRLLELGVYVIGFSFPVVPVGKARIRTQLTAAHTREHLDQAVAAFTTAGREIGILGGTS